MIEHTIDRFRFLIDTKPFKEYEELQTQARGEAYYTDPRYHRERFVVMCYLDIPIVSMSHVNGGLYPANVGRISDLYTSDYLRTDRRLQSAADGAAEHTKQFRYGMKLVTNEIVDMFTPYDLTIVSKKADQRLWKRWMAAMNYSSDEGYYYLVTNPKGQSSSWRRVFYRGDLSLLDSVEKMSSSTYEMMFNGQS